MLSTASLRVGMHGRLVGTLALTEDGVAAFQYASSWVEKGFSMSSLSLPLEGKVFVAKSHPLGGLFGVFDDSLPDSRGHLLVDRTLREHGVDPYSIGPLARLAIVGKSGMGALEYESEVPLALPSVLGDLDEIEAACVKILAMDYSDDLDALFALSGSSGGTRPRFSQLSAGRTGSSKSLLPLTTITLVRKNMYSRVRRNPVELKCLESGSAIEGTLGLFCHQAIR